MPFPARAHFDWQLRTRTMPLGTRTLVMGIVNVTPDSFSDGGEHATTERAVAHAMCLLDEGADMLDIGGESTRPGSPAATPEAISTAEEQDRVLPVIEGVLRLRPSAVLSVDTYRSATARAAVKAGAEIVNDVSGGLWDEAMFATCADLQCGTVVIHTRGLPHEWKQQEPVPSGDLMPQVLKELDDRLREAMRQGVVRARIVADPGFGFGKRGAENWQLLEQFSALSALGFPLLAGLSRKGFLLSATSAMTPDTTTVRDALTHTADTATVLAGAHLLRVHDVGGAVHAARVADAIMSAGKADM